MTKLPVYNAQAQLDEVAAQLEALFVRYETEFDRQRDEKSGYVNRLSGWIGTNPILLKTTPGSGKTTKAVEFVNRLAEKGIYAAYFSLSHSIIDDMFDKYADMATWGHWEGHSKKCPEAAKNHQLQELGYTVDTKCDCDWADQFRTDRPAIMPVEYSLASDIDSVTQSLPEYIEPQQSKVNDFAIRIFDEMDFNKFVGGMDVSYNELAITAASHPNEYVKTVSGSLLSIWDNLADKEHLSGSNLIEKLDVLGTEEVLTELREKKTGIQRTPWLESGHPPNFAPLLVPILNDELDYVNRGHSFNPRIHLIKDENDSKLSIRWRKQVPVDIPVIFMDASADENLLTKVFGGFTKKRVEKIDVEIPDTVTIKQYPFKRVGMQSLNIRPYDRGKDSRKTQHQWLKHDLSDIKKSSSVGIVTFSELEVELKEVVESMRFKTVLTAHYGNLRSLNELEGSDVLILMGCPTPNSDEITLTAQAFFYDESLMDTSWGKSKELWDLGNGRSFEVEMGGFIDDNLNSFQVQKVEWELFQALHRSRPIRVETHQRPTILVYTNVPVPDTKVSSAVGRWGHTVKAIQKALEGNDKCSAMAVAVAKPWLELKLNSQEKWVREHAVELASLAGVQWDGKNFRT
jgi:hypothetical protein